MGPRPQATIANGAVKTRYGGFVFAQRFSVAAVCLLLSTAAYAGAARLPASPEAAVERLVVLNNSASLQSPEGKALLAGELEKLDAPGAGLMPAADKVMRTAAGAAVARVPGGGGAPDIYVYLEQTAGGWQVVAVRALALTGIIEEAIGRDAEAPSQDPKDRQAVVNAKLTISSDAELMRWAAHHRALLGRARTEPVSEGLTRELAAAGASDVRRQDGLIIVSIGGMVDNEVGFLLPVDGSPPAITRDSWIWVEPALDGWYLFKTT